MEGLGECWFWTTFLGFEGAGDGDKLGRRVLAGTGWEINLVSLAQERTWMVSGTWSIQLRLSG